MTEIERRLSELGTWRDRNRGISAPHKPLLLLWMLSQLEPGAPRLRLFRDVQPELTRLLRAFGPSRRSLHPEYPFWWLRTDGFWEVKADGPLTKREGHGDPKKSELLAKNARAGFLPRFHEGLESDAGLRATAMQLLLRNYFPASVHHELLDALEMEIDRASGGLSKSGFRRAVLQAYDGTCAICGFRIAMDGVALGVDASFIQWPSAGGPNSVQNGIALCTLHQQLFDRGAVSISDDGVVVVSQRLTGEEAALNRIRRALGSKIKVPDDPTQRPLVRNLLWHRRWVFRD